jgi:hypothetical protein
MNLSTILFHSIFYGLVLSVGLSLMIFVSLYINAEMWLQDYPPDVRTKFGPMSARAKRQRAWLALPFFLYLLGVLAVSILRLEPLVEMLTFTAVFLHTFALLFTFNLFDLLIVDWLIMMSWRPQFIILPGTEGMAGYNDYRFHFVGFLKGTVGMFVGSLVIAGLVTAIW